MRGGGEEGECEKNALARARETEAGWRKITREANVLADSRVERERERGK